MLLGGQMPVDFSGRQSNPCGMKGFVLCFLLVGLSGCIIIPAEHGTEHSRGVPLSEAMEASASGSKEPLDGSGSSESLGVVFAVVPDDSEGDSGGSGGGALVDYGDTEYRWQVPLDVSYRVPFNGQIEAITMFTVTPFAVEDKRNFFGFYLGGGIVDLESGSLPERAIKDTWTLETGVTYRRYFNDPHVFFSPYFTASVSGQFLVWEYRNAIVVDGDTVGTDNLAGAGGYAGFGVALQRKKWLNLFAEAGFGGIVFVGETGQSFSNDVFNDFGYFSVKAGLTFKF